MGRIEKYFLKPSHFIAFWKPLASGCHLITFSSLPLGRIIKFTIKCFTLLFYHLSINNCPVECWINAVELQAEFETLFSIVTEDSQTFPDSQIQSKVWKLGGLWYLFSSPFQQLTVLKRVPQILRLEPPSCHAHYKLRQMNHLSPSGTLNICFHWRQSLCKLPQSLDSQRWLSHYYSNSHFALQGSGYNWISAESQGCQMCKQPINWSTNCCLR